MTKLEVEGLKSAGSMEPDLRLLLSLSPPRPRQIGSVRKDVALAWLSNEPASWLTWGW